MCGWLRRAAGAAGEDIDPSTLEFVDDFEPAVQREIALAMEDIVNGTVKAVGKDGVTVAYTLEDGTAVEVGCRQAHDNLNSSSSLGASGASGAAVQDETLKNANSNKLQVQGPAHPDQQQQHSWTVPILWLSTILLFPAYVVPLMVATGLQLMVAVGCI